MYIVSVSTYMQFLRKTVFIIQDSSFTPNTNYTAPAIMYSYSHMWKLQLRIFHATYMKNKQVILLTSKHFVIPNPVYILLVL